MLSEITLILLILNMLLSLWTIRVLSLAIQNGLGLVMTSIHDRLDSLLEGGLGDFEPPNPIQQALAQILTQRVQNLPIETIRGEDGKFSAEKIS